MFADAKDFCQTPKDVVKVRLLKPYQPFNTGEGAAFPSSVAAELIDRGVAIREEQSKVMTPPKDKQMTTGRNKHKHKKGSYEFTH